MSSRGKVGKACIRIAAFDKHTSFGFNDAVDQTNNYNQFIFVFKLEFRGSNWAMHLKQLLNAKNKIVKDPQANCKLKSDKAEVQ